MINNAQDLLVNDIYTVKHLINSVNWDFFDKSNLSPNELHPFNCRKYHWYPATFIPEIPFTLIEILTKPNAIVYDPFAGIGTTYFQALLLNRKPLASENCKIAVAFIKSMCILINSENSFEAINKYAVNIYIKYNFIIDYSINLPPEIKIDLLKPWYSKKTFNQLCYLFLCESQCTNPIIKAAFLIVISSILVTVSSQHRGWGYIADNVHPKEDQISDKKVLDIFYKNLIEMLTDISKHLKFTSKLDSENIDDFILSQTIFNEDSKTSNVVSDNSVDLILTSPPYPNMVDYVTAQRLSYYFMGLDFNNDLEFEIGARKRRNNKNAIDKYLSDMKNVNKNISRTLKVGGYLCYVLPDFNINKNIDNTRKSVINQIVLDLEEYNLIKEEEITRLLPSKKRSHNLKWSTLESEKIYIFRKG